MSLTMTCRHCDAVINAENEDTLVERVQAHALTHDGRAPLTRDHILRRFYRLQAREERTHQQHRP
jgi:hypothetical protein